LKGNSRLRIQPLQCANSVPRAAGIIGADDEAATRPGNPESAITNDPSRRCLHSLGTPIHPKIDAPLPACGSSHELWWRFRVVRAGNRLRAVARRKSGRGSFDHGAPDKDGGVNAVAAILNRPLSRAGTSPIIRILAVPFRERTSLCLVDAFTDNVEWGQLCLVGTKSCNALNSSKWPGIRTEATASHVAAEDGRGSGPASRR
jgi:hypothetical protein